MFFFSAQCHFLYIITRQYPSQSIAFHIRSISVTFKKLHLQNWHILPVRFIKGLVTTSIQCLEKYGVNFRRSSKRFYYAVQC